MAATPILMNLCLIVIPALPAFLDELGMGGTVAVIDDLHWADEASLAVWGRLHRAVHQLPLLLVAAARPVAARPELAALRDSLTGPDTVVTTLRPLTAGQAVDVVGRFTMSGAYDRQTGRVLLLKQYVGKIIQVKAGHSLSLQYHREKEETISMLTGEALVRYGPAADHFIDTLPHRTGVGSRSYENGEIRDVRIGQVFQQRMTVQHNESALS